MTVFAILGILAVCGFILLVGSNFNRQYETLSPKTVLSAKPITRHWDRIILRVTITGAAFFWLSYPIVNAFYDYTSFDTFYGMMQVQYVIAAPISLTGLAGLFRKKTHSCICAIVISALSLAWLVTGCYWAFFHSSD